jgi:hypothetical protein
MCRTPFPQAEGRDDHTDCVVLHRDLHLSALWEVLVIDGLYLRTLHIGSVPMTYTERMLAARAYVVEQNDPPMVDLIDLRLWEDELGWLDIMETDGYGYGYGLRVERDE